MKRKSKNSSEKNDELALEMRRQFIHFSGILTVPIMLFVERTAAMILLGGFLALITILSFYRAKRPFQAGWLENFVAKRERPGVYPLSGSVFFFLGVFCAFLLYQPVYAAAATAVLALGDSTSTVVGKLWGNHSLFGTRRTWEGSATFFLFAFAALLLFVQPQKALIVAFLTAAVEALPRIDDNFSVPIAAGLFLTLL